MVKFKPSFAFALIAGLALQGMSPAEARRGDQDDARAATQRGTIRSLRLIEANVVPAMQKRGARYIGAEFDGQSLRYRLKFMRQASVIWIDVDGKSGAIIAQAGN